jgi:hypothetical protein
MDTAKTRTSFLPSFEATAAEQAAMLLRMDRTHIRRRSEDKAAPAFKVDGNVIARILVLAIAVENKTYKHRKKGDHRGELGAVSIELLKVLIWFGRKYGQIFPSLEKLGRTLRKHTDTIISALKRLIDQGFVVKHRRSRYVTDVNGFPRRRQDSNAYEVRLPKPNVGAARIPCLQALVSDPKNSDLSCHQTASVVGKSNPELPWEALPYKMRDGSWH